MDSNRVAAVGIVTLGLIELGALISGVDGQLLATVIAAITAIAGYAYGRSRTD